MTKLQSWMMTGLAVVALVAGVLLATGAISSAQEGTATPSPTADASDDDTDTATPEATDDTDDGADTDDDDAGDSTDDEADADEDEGEHRCGGGKYAIKQAAAEVLGLTEEELIGALQDGQSLAEIAEAQGMSVEDFRTSLLAAVTADLQAELDAGEITQEEFDEITSELDENLDDIINSEGGIRFHRFHGPSGESDEEASASDA